jgi:hypothetical protein
MKVAQIDVDGVYLGQIEIDRDEFDPAIHVDAVEYGGDCDIHVGPKFPKYRWTGKCFEPMNDHQAEVARDIQRIIDFAAAKSAESPEVDELVKKHFPAEHRLARVKAR